MNTLQMTLFDLAPTYHPPFEDDASIRARFEVFDRENPHIFTALRDICLEVRGQGLRQWGIKAAYEQARWMPALRTTGTTVKLPNDLHSHYSRKLMAEVPELAGFFTTRELRAP